MAYTVKTRHIGRNEADRRGENFGSLLEAELHALSINSKPFSSYYAWVEPMAPSEPAPNSYIG